MKKRHNTRYRYS